MPLLGGLPGPKKFGQKQFQKGQILKKLKRPHKGQIFDEIIFKQLEQFFEIIKYGNFCSDFSKTGLTRYYFLQLSKKAVKWPNGQTILWNCFKKGQMATLSFGQSGQDKETFFSLSLTMIIVKTYISHQT